MRKCALRLAGAAWVATALFWLVASADAQTPPTPTSTIITLSNPATLMVIEPGGTIAAGDVVSDFGVAVTVPDGTAVTEGVITEFEFLGGGARVLW